MRVKFLYKLLELQQFGNLGSADFPRKGSYQSIYGKFERGWERKDGKTVFTVMKKE